MDSDFSSALNWKIMDMMQEIGFIKMDVDSVISWCMVDEELIVRWSKSIVNEWTNKFRDIRLCQNAPWFFCLDAVSLTVKAMPGSGLRILS